MRKRAPGNTHPPAASRHSSRARWRRCALAVTAVAAIGTLSGCGGASFATMTPNLPETKPESSAKVVEDVPVAPVRAATPPERSPSDLELGSHTAKRNAGPVTVVIDYWTDQVADEWTGQPATVSFALRLARPITKSDIRISQVRVTADDRSVVLEDRGRFAIRPPFSYGSGFVTPATDDEEMTLRLQADLLIETEPGSGAYFRQTVFDTLHLTFEGGRR